MMKDPLKQLEGEQLSAVTFVQDYIQLHFDGPCINVHMPIRIEVGGVTTRSGDAHFRNALCEQIAKIIQSVTFQESEALTLAFGDGSRIAISLRADDYSSPEAINAYGFKDAGIVVV